MYALKELESVSNVEVRELPWKLKLINYKNRGGRGNFKKYLDGDGNVIDPPEEAAEAAELQPAEDE